MKKIVVSNYNSNLNWLKLVFDCGFKKQDILIYDRSDEKIDFDSELQIIKSPNVGANLYDIFTFIIDNYNNIPDETIFLKGNLFSPRSGDIIGNKNKPDDYYTTKEKFIQALNSKCLYSCWDNPVRYSVCKHSTKYMLDNGRMSQPLAYCSFSVNSGVETQYYNNPNQVLQHCFQSPPNLNFFEFIPASNMVVPKKNILMYTPNLYKKLRNLISYTPHKKYTQRNPGECYLIERILYYIWTNQLVEKI